MVDSGYESVPLDALGERVEKIVQFNKTGRIFYSSHLDDFTGACIKELNLDS